jgi:F-type H+-transporting ATPase subunit gamma
MASLGRRIPDKRGVSPLLVGTGKDDVHLLVVMTGERGLAGGFNANIAKLARNDAQQLLSQGKTVKFLMVGRKGAEALRREFEDHYVDCINLRGVRQLEFTHADDIAGKVFALFEAGEFDVATIYYAEFKSVISQIPTALQLIPAKIPEDTGSDKSAGADAVHEYEPSEEEVLGHLINLNVSTQIFRGLLENLASFYGAQMSAMDAATRNAGEMIDKLTLQYNRQRQANITKELIEIISGAEAL